MASTEPSKRPEEEEEEEEEEPGEVEEEEEEGKGYNPGQKRALKEQLEMDKDDESLRRWKEQLLANAEIPGEGKGEAEVEFRMLSILVDGRDAIELPIPKKGTVVDEKAAQFTLKERTKYKLMFEFTVRHELVVGLVYSNKVWRSGIQVDKKKVMLGVYAPQAEPYTYVTEEETTPHGMLARGHYTAKTVFLDDDGKVYLEFNYTFDIVKDREGAD